MKKINNLNLNSNIKKFDLGSLENISPVGSSNLQEFKQKLGLSVNSNTSGLTGSPNANTGYLLIKNSLKHQPSI